MYAGIFLVLSSLVFSQVAYDTTLKAFIMGKFQC